MCRYPFYFFFEFLLGHSITAGICEVNFHFFDTIANICYEPLISAFRETRHAERLSRLLGLPYLPRWDNSSTRVVSSPLVNIHTNGWLNFTGTKGKVNSPRVTRGGLSRVPETMGPKQHTLTQNNCLYCVPTSNQSPHLTAAVKLRFLFTRKLPVSNHITYDIFIILHSIIFLRFFQKWNTWKWESVAQNG